MYYRYPYRRQNLKKLPKIDPDIEKLDCSYNKIKILPKLNILVLDCVHNKIRILPNLPNIDCMYFGYNRIKKMQHFSTLMSYDIHFYTNKIKDYSSNHILYYCDKSDKHNKYVMLICKLYPYNNYNK